MNFLSMEPLNIGEAPHSPSQRKGPTKNSGWIHRATGKYGGSKERSKIENIWGSVLQIQLPFENQCYKSRSYWNQWKKHFPMANWSHLWGGISPLHRNELIQFKYTNNIPTFCQFNHTKSNLFGWSWSFCFLVKFHEVRLFIHSIQQQTDGWTTFSCESNPGKSLSQDRGTSEKPMDETANLTGTVWYNIGILTYIDEAPRICWLDESTFYSWPMDL